MSRSSMATRVPPGTSAADTTDFVLHKSQQTRFNDILDKIIDYTEKRLLRYAEKTKDAQQRVAIMALALDYKAGRVAVAWRRGDPVYVYVTKE